MVTLNLLHFNDVYRVRQKHKASGGTLGADQFAAKIQSIRQSWGEPAELANLPHPEQNGDWSEHAKRKRNGLVLFSGDLFSPSVESSVTRGTHLVPVINAMNLDCACLGNHDWDFGYPHLQTLMSQTNFPWLFSNVVDAGESKQAWDECPQQDDKQVQGTLQSWTTTVQGVKVGVIGIVEKEWIATVPSFPTGFVYRNMAETALQLSKKLRDPQREACELIIALTHSRLPNDIDLANQIGAVMGADASQHGVDLILGGHDHIYYIGNGATSFSGEPGTEKDKNALVVKSGTDFRDLSELKLELSPRDTSAVRQRTIKSLSVQRHRTSPDDPASPEVKQMLDDLLAKISQSTGQTVAHTLTPWDVRSEKVRTEESAFGGFVADVLMYSYEEVLRERDNRGELQPFRPAGAREVDCCIICGGSLRGDQVYGPGKIALSDVLEILPFEDAVVCKELTGRDIWDALENGLSMYPKQEGRFPQVAGLQVQWDSRKPPGQRLVSVHLLDHPLDTPVEGMQPVKADGVGKIRQYTVKQGGGGGYDVQVHRPALKVRGELEMDTIYRVVTREYLAEGYDGFEALKRGRFIVDHENGQLMSAIVRKFLLGASFIWRMKQVRENVPPLSGRTSQAVTRARALNAFKAGAAEGPSTPVKRAKAQLVVDQSPGGFRDALHVGGSEHHSQFDLVSKRLAARQRTAEEEEEAMDAQDLFDPEYAPQLMERIRKLCALLAQAAGDAHSLTVPTSSSTVEDQPVETDDYVAPNITLGATSEEEEHLVVKSKGVKAEPTQLSRDLVAEARKLKLAFDKLEQAAGGIKGGEMDLAEQTEVVRKLEGYISRQRPPKHEGSVSHSLHVEQDDADLLKQASDDCAIISPLTDGRLRDVARDTSSD